MSEGDYREKGSKFLAFAFPCSSVEEFKSELNLTKKKYHDARHWCFGFRINPESPEVRANDDGEPSNSAGMPIYNQLLSHELWNAGVVVVRYFGGTKLGVSGLINAYKSSASEALGNAVIRTQLITQELRIEFPYKLMNDISRLIKEEELQILAEEMHLNGGYKLAVRKNDLERIIEKISHFHEVKIL